MAQNVVRESLTLAKHDAASSSYSSVTVNIALIPHLVVNVGNYILKISNNINTPTAVEVITMRASICRSLVQIVEVT